ncbi:MAG: hypothetical protein ABI560_04885, partial [Myxococcales bacterium]
RCGGMVRLNVGMPVSGLVTVVGMIPFFTSFGSACAGRASASTSHRKRSAAASAVEQFRRTTGAGID